MKLNVLFKALLLSCLLSQAALAWPLGGGNATPPLPPSAPAQVAGPVTITWTETANAMMSFLEERPSGGTWATVSAPNSNGQVTLSRSPGVYEYRVKEFGFTDDEFEPLDYTLYSTVITVTVISTVIPVEDAIEVQIGYDFTFASGDINFDGRQDIYIERVTGDLDNGVLAQAIIVLQADGSYARFLPTLAQLQTAQSWVPIALDYSIGDFNLDEVGDMALKGLPNNARQHLLISSGDFFARNALAVIPTTDAIDRFYGDLAASITDAGHFDDAQSAPVHGYNVRVIGRVTTCYYWSWVPFCYSHDFTLWEHDFTLEELGLGSFLGATPSKATTATSSKIASQRAQLQSAAVFHTPTVENASAVTMAEHNVTTLAGTAAEKSAVLTMMEDVLPMSDPEVLVCVYWCGYQVWWDYNYSVTFQWVDIWTPITMDGGFDEDNYSKAAFDLTLILDKPEDEITDDEWITVGSILTATTDIPIPGPWPQDKPDTEKKKKFRWNLAIWAFIEFMEQFKPLIWMNHYTGDTGWHAIDESKTIIAPSAPVGGPIWFTHLDYYWPDVAEDKLALCGEHIVGFYSVRLVDVLVWIDDTETKVLPKTCPPDDPVQPGVYHPGQGWERRAASPVVPLPLMMRRTPIVEGYTGY